jgi:hypothetical protein
MTTLTADDAMTAALRQANSLTEIRDSNGTIIGFFAPVGLDRAPLYAQLAASADPQEIKRRGESGGKTYTTEEVLDRLRSPETH